MSKKRGKTVPHNLENDYRWSLNENARQDLLGYKSLIKLYHMCKIYPVVSRSFFRGFEVILCIYLHTMKLHRTQV